MINKFKICVENVNNKLKFMIYGLTHRADLVKAIREFLLVNDFDNFLNLYIAALWFSFCDE